MGAPLACQVCNLSLCADPQIETEFRRESTLYSAETGIEPGGACRGNQSLFIKAHEGPSSPTFSVRLLCVVSLPFPGPTARAEWFLEVHPESVAAAGAPVSSVCVYSLLLLLCNLL
jgi:hypothetical protein